MSIAALVFMAVVISGTAVFAIIVLAYKASRKRRK